MRKEAAMKRGWIGILIVFSFWYGLHVSEAAAAEPDYPVKPVEITVASAPGGGTDLGARAVAEKLRESLGQEFVVINKSGGGHRVTMTLLSRTKPDGYTLGAVPDESIVHVPFIEKINYKPLEFTFLATFGRMDFGFFVMPDSPFKSLKDMIEFARANPNKLSFGVTEVNSRTHVALMALGQTEGIKINIVPFMGAAPTTMALLGGHVMVAGSGSSGFARHVKSKTVRLLAVVSNERLDEYPGVPTLKELGYPKLVFDGMYVFVGPKNLPKSVVTRLEGAMRKAIESPNFIKVATETGIYEKRPLFGEELKEALSKRYAENENIIKALGLKPKE
jgi:tripartite-type tricarboxylate transporter receptor subunit TctC